MHVQWEKPREGTSQNTSGGKSTEITEGIVEGKESTEEEKLVNLNLDLVWLKAANDMQGSLMSEEKDDTSTLEKNFKY